jgi:DNA-binding NarL/FixJ family response regulator
VESLVGPTCEVVGSLPDGQSLFETAMHLMPDVIVSDISMPILNGIEAAVQLNEAGCTSKIIFLSVHSDPDFIRTCLAAGAFGYVVKSQISTDLIPAIQEALAGRIFISPFMHRHSA